MLDKGKERLFYWLTVLVLAAMIVYTHSEYKDQQVIIDRTHKVGNAQLEIMAASYTSLVNQQSIRHMNEIVELEEHHKQEIAELIEFYTEKVEND